MKVERQGGLLRVTLDAPERRNILNADDCQALSAAVRDTESNAVLIESTGPVFCGGIEPGAGRGNLFDPWNTVPVVIAVQGPAVDDGLALLACAHVVVAAQGASFALTGVRNAGFPELHYRVLARAVGDRRALELALTGRVFTAPEALAWGLVHQVAPAFEFDDRAESVALALASKRICLPAARS